MTRTLTKLQLKKAIILEDARRVQSNREVINNVWKLAKELEDKFPKLYETDKVGMRLYDLQKHGTTNERISSIKTNQLIDNLCVILNTKKEELTEEIEL